MSRSSNRLINESSPYLLQHAYNPVDWYPWNDEALEKARAENKMIIVSIGYSACHWCHVMEHQSFEDEKVARIMNDLFVCIKVDREERPDIDQVYMSAVQLMTGQGGWPLNCFTLPDGRPIFGGTYFPKEKWISALISLADLWKTESEKCMQYAHELTQGVQQLDSKIWSYEGTDLLQQLPDKAWQSWSERIDSTEGGPNRAPKFPLPNNYLFLLRYYHLSKNESALKHVTLTLDKIAMGGINDHVGGGFARYSTDMLWKVPHFEKMLYDNGQLVSLYSEAYQLTGNEFYLNTIRETLKWVNREMTSEEGAFYSALDADSEGVEGKYYVWKKEELQNILREDFELIADVFNVNSIGYWEEENYVLVMRESLPALAAKHKLSVEQLNEKIGKAKMLLLAERGKRVRPGLDDKILTSWNAMMLRGYVDAWKVTNDPEYLLAAKKNAKFIIGKQLKDDGTLWHSYKNGKSSINGFLEDYAFVIDAFIALYQTDFDPMILEKAWNLCVIAQEKFHSTKSPMLYFTSVDDPELISRKYETSDNVTPASNSVMARNMFYLGRLFGDTGLVDRSEIMLKCVEREMMDYGPGYSNWLILALNKLYPFREVAIVGKDVDKTAAAFRKLYLPNAIFAGSPEDNRLEDQIAVLQNRRVEGKTLIYVCENNTCQLPVTELEDALKQLN
jgi:uncharacterized protein